MAQIKIYGDSVKGCIFFDGSTVEPKFLGTITSSIKADEPTRIVIQRTDRFEQDGVTFRKLFKRLNYERVQNSDGVDLVAGLGYTVQQVVQYINEQSSAYSASGAVTLALDETPNFALDATSTSILVDNGATFPVNSIKAILGEDGLIDIISSDFSSGAVTHYEDIDHTTIQVAGASVSGGANDVVNTLNELFTVGAFESVVISDPYATMVADVSGVTDSGSTVGSNAIDPVGDDILASASSHYNRCGWLSDESIDQAGEYFTFDIRVTDSMGFGLVLDQGEEKYGAGSYADPAMFCNDSTSNSAAWGYYWSHWFHSGNKGPWTYYGQRTSSSIREGWGAFGSSDERASYIADAPIKMKVGIDANGYMEVCWYDVSESTWRQVQRSSYVIEEGESLKLGIKIYGTRGRLHTVPKKHLLEPAAPTMYFRYIESPDGNFEYPLFATEDEANYYDSQNGGTGSGTSHTHTYTDDPSGTTWYMPDNGGTMTGTSAPSFDLSLGFSATYTEITSLTNADQAPPQFTATNVTQEEGTNVNIQVTPAGATWSTSASISPSGSGLVFDGTSLIQGTLADVGADTVYTITVTRGNSYGSTTGSMTVTATDVAPTQTSDTPWTKALDFSGSSERTEMVSGSAVWNPLMMNGASSQIALPATGQTVSSGHPWATACVFKIDGNSSNQHIWNLGEGAGTNDDNIYLRVDSNQRLLFGWGRQGATNECYIHTLSSAWWYGIYVGFNGARYGAAGSTASRLNDIFDIRLISSIDSFASLSTMPQLMSGWTHGASSTGGRMDRQFTGKLTLGGRGANRNFHGKIASFVSTTLPCGVAMPTDVEIKEMIVDPMGWLYDSKAGNAYRRSDSTSTTSNFVIGSAYGAAATQIWLMGDGVQDSYSNMIRNQVWSGDQNYTKMNMLSMVSNDIQTVNINGLT